MQDRMRNTCTCMYKRAAEQLKLVLAYIFLFTFLEWDVETKIRIFESSKWRDKGVEKHGQVQWSIFTLTRHAVTMRWSDYHYGNGIFSFGFLAFGIADRCTHEKSNNMRNWDEWYPLQIGIIGLPLAFHFVRGIWINSEPECRMIWFWHFGAQRSSLERLSQHSRNTTVLILVEPLGRNHIGRHALQVQRIAGSEIKTLAMHPWSNEFGSECDMFLLDVRRSDWVRNFILTNLTEDAQTIGTIRPYSEKATCVRWNKLIAADTLCRRAERRTALRTPAHICLCLVLVSVWNTSTVLALVHKGFLVDPLFLVLTRQA